MMKAVSFPFLKNAKKKRRSICTNIHVVTVGQRLPFGVIHGFVNTMHNRKR